MGIEKHVWVLFADQGRAQSANLYGIDTGGASCGQGDAATGKTRSGDEASVGGIDVHGGTVGCTVDEEPPVRHAEGDALRLVLRQAGNAGGQTEDVEQSGIGINLAPAIENVLVGSREIGLGLVAGTLNDAVDVLRGEVGLGLQPQGNDTSGNRCGHRRTAHGPHVPQAG